MSDDGLKLYVVGDSPDPEQWSDWCSKALVLARSADEAERLVDSIGGSAVLVDSSKPLVLMVHAG